MYGKIADRSSKHQYHYRHRHQAANVAPIIINLRFEQIEFLLCPFFKYLRAIIWAFGYFQGIQLMLLGFNALEIQSKSSPFLASTLDLLLRWGDWLFWSIYFLRCWNFYPTAKFVSAFFLSFSLSLNLYFSLCVSRHSEICRNELFFKSNTKQKSKKTFVDWLELSETRAHTQRSRLNDYRH